MGLTLGAAPYQLLPFPFSPGVFVHESLAAEIPACSISDPSWDMITRRGRKSSMCPLERHDSFLNSAGTGWSSFWAHVCVCVCPYCWYSFRISLRDCPFQLICTSMDLAEFLFTFSSSWACSPGLLSDGHSCVTLFAEIPQGPLSFHPSICRVHLLSVFALCLPSAAHYHIDTQSPGGDPWSQQSWGPRPLRYAVIENSNSPYNCQT